MKLELAVVVTCTETGCCVRHVGNKTFIEAWYSSLVINRIKIQPAQLVAIDMSANPPEIVWRWLRASVIELNADILVVDDMQGHPAKVSRVQNLPLTLALDDEVWVCSTGRDYEVHDIIVDGKPAHPNRLLGYIVPIIEKVYQNATPA